MLCLKLGYFVCRIGSIGSSWSEKGYESDGFQVRSKTVENSSDPEWNAFFSLNLAQDLGQLSSQTDEESEKGLELTLRVYDEDIGDEDIVLEGNEKGSLKPWENTLYSLTQNKVPKEDQMKMRSEIMRKACST